MILRFYLSMLKDEVFIRLIWIKLWVEQILGKRLEFEFWSLGEKYVQRYKFRYYREVEEM